MQSGFNFAAALRAVILYEVAFTGRRSCIQQG